MEKLLQGMKQILEGLLQFGITLVLFLEIGVLSKALFLGDMEEFLANKGAILEAEWSIVGGKVVMGEIEVAGLLKGELPLACKVVFGDAK